MATNNVFSPEPIPWMWAVILFRIRQAEERDRILQDWEDVVFGPVLRQRRRRRPETAIRTG